jgi:hypothetical protein
MDKTHCAFDDANYGTKRTSTHQSTIAGWMDGWMNEWMDGWMDSMSWKYIGGFRAWPIVAKLGVPTSICCFGGNWHLQ